MKARGRGLLTAAAVAGILLVVMALLPVLGDCLARKMLESTVTRGTGLPCRIGSVRREGRRFLVSGVEIGSAGEPPRFTISAATVGLFNSGRLGSVRIDKGTLSALLPGWPEITLRELEIDARNLELLEKPEGAAAVVLRGRCVDLNPLLEKAGKVRFERGSFRIESHPHTSGRELDVPVAVKLTGFKVRSLDGRFEVEAEQARATVRITGTRDDPVLDLGELEPWLGAEFAGSSGKPRP